MGESFINPIPCSLADPYVILAEDGRYYLYGTSPDADAFLSYSSKDLVHWRAEGTIYQPEKGAWCKDTFWAPECYYISGKYYLLFSANWKHNPRGEAENFRIGAAVSDNPNGPFVDLYDRPIFDPGFPVIDANLWREDGRYYLYFSRCCYHHLVDGLEESCIYGVEMHSDFSGIIGEPKLMLKPEQDWEGRSAPTQGRRWNEGSAIAKHQGKYYMTFSANCYLEPHYAIGYATADHPLGPWTKAAENPILQQTDEVEGTGHSCFLYNQGRTKLWMVYHGRTQETGEQRVPFLDEVFFDEKGKLRVQGPTLSPENL